jgi:hypothetical protein
VLNDVVLEWIWKTIKQIDMIGDADVKVLVRVSWCDSINE